MNNSFTNVISLGYFCDVAGELEKYGLRDASYPFDWMISDFSGVIKCIEEEFKDFLNIEYLSQSAKNRTHYKNEKYNFYFFHDFDKYKSLEEQYSQIVTKYKRRTERFLEMIKLPTLFIRYISDEFKDKNGKSIELDWIENHLELVLKILKSYNKKNEIMFIANEGVTSQVITIYNVKPDENDRVARKWISKNDYLKNYFLCFEYPKKDKNLLHLKEKQKKRKNILLRILRLIRRNAKKVFLNEYIYFRQYDISNE